MLTNIPPREAASVWDTLFGIDKLPSGYPCHGWNLQQSFKHISMAIANALLLLFNIILGVLSTENANKNVGVNAKKIILYRLRVLLLLQVRNDSLHCWQSNVS